MYIDEKELIAVLKKHNIPHKKVSGCYDEFILISFDGTGTLGSADELKLWNVD